MSGGQQAPATPFDLGAHLEDAEARLARIAELVEGASRMRSVAIDGTLREIKRLAEGGPDTTTEEKTAR